MSPNFWADPKTGVPYQVAVQTPEYRLSSMSDLENTPLMLSGGRRCQAGNAVECCDADARADADVDNP